MGLHPEPAACVRGWAKTQTRCATCSPQVCSPQARAFSLPGKTGARRGPALDVYKRQLQESRAAGDFNDLPEINYDFNAPIRQFGTISDSYRELRLLALFLNDFGADLAPLPAEIEPDNVSPGDLHTLRLACRKDNSHGYLFFSNYQRRRGMEPHPGTRLSMKLGAETVPFPPVDIAPGQYGFFPCRMRLGDAVLRLSLIHISTWTPPLSSSSRHLRPPVFGMCWRKWKSRLPSMPHPSRRNNAGWQRGPLGFPASLSWRPLTQKGSCCMTIEEIAKELGVSKSTVSRALSGKGRLGEETRRRILQFAAQAGRRAPQETARRPERALCLGLVIPADVYISATPFFFFQDCMLGVSETASQQQCNVMLEMCIRDSLYMKQ